MAWTAAKFGDVEKANGVARVTVVFTNDQDASTFTRVLTIDGEPENLKRQVAAEIARANAVDAQVAAVIKEQTVDTTPAEKDLTPLQAFTRDFHAAQRMKRAIDIGVLPANHKAFTDLVSSLAAAWDESFAYTAMI